MALAEYSRTFWFPNGALAVGIAARVFPENSSALAPIFTDVTGTVPLPNPLSTDGAGVLTFWAEEGEYWIHADSEAFRVSVGNPNDLDVFDGASVALSTGVMSGGNLVITGATTVDLSETVGYVVDYSTDDFRPSLTRVHMPAQTVTLVGASLTRTVTYLLADSSGTIIQQGTQPTNIERRTRIVLAALAFDTATMALFDLVAIPQILAQPENQLLDLMFGLGPFSTSGNQVTVNGANLQFNTSAGALLQPSWAYNTTPDDPHEAPTAALAPAQFRYGLRNTVAFPPLTTFIDAANYDNAGVLTPIGGGSGSTTLHRVFKFASNFPSGQTTVQYGQTVYPNLAAAVDAAGKSSFVQNPQFALGALVAWIAVTRVATDLSDPTQAVIIQASPFSRP